jgi:hypothetical protein
MKVFQSTPLFQPQKHIVQGEGGFLISFLLRSPCKISEHYNNTLWDNDLKSPPQKRESRQQKKEKLMPIIMAATLASLVHAICWEPIFQRFGDVNCDRV